MAAQTVSARDLGARARTIAPKGRRDHVGYVFIAPAVILFLVFIGLPFLAAIALSFTHWDLLTSIKFAGVDNYVQLVRDAQVRKAVGNTFIFAFASVVTHIGFGLLLAVAVSSRASRVLRYVLRTAFFFPFLVSWAAVALLWKYVLDPTFGIGNYYLHLVGLPTANWLASPSLALPSLIVVDFWHTIGYTFVILLAGLQTVPQHLHEAAKVDGAGALRRFWHVTLPMMSPTLFFATVITFIGAFQIFDPMVIMTQGGPDGNTESVVMYVYQQAFQSFQMGYASTVALIVFVVMMLVTLLQFRLSRLWVHS